MGRLFGGPDRTASPLRSVLALVCRMGVSSLINSMVYRSKRALVVYSEFGTRELLLRFLRGLGFRDRQLSTWLEHKARADAEFDGRFGTDTGGVQNLAEQDGVVGANAKYGLAHIATDPLQFSDLMNGLNLPVSDLTFVDLGCGKGRALLLAAQYPFKSIIGVEFVPAFAEAAQQNLKMAAIRGLRQDIEVVLGDATLFAFPQEPLLVYLFNPFDSHIIQQVANNARASWRSRRRPFVIVYANPIHKDVFLNGGWRISQQGNGWIAFECDA